MLDCAAMNRTPSNVPTWTRYERCFTILTGLFVTFVVLTNTVGVKLFDAGGRILPVSILWYA